MAEQGTERTKKASEDVKDLARGVGEITDAARSDGAGGAQKAVADNVDRLQEKAQDAVQQVRGMTPEDAQQVLEKVLDWTKKQPAYALGGALALGFLVGKAWGRLTGHGD